MIFSHEILIRGSIALLGVGGFFVARYIYRHKKYQTPLVCPMQFDCHAVIHSDYSKFLGIPVEILGMIYYAFIFFSYAFLIIIPIVQAVTLGALVFSIYLIGVQIFILKKGCSWCLVSALISILIFILSVII